MLYRILNWDCSNDKPVPEAYIDEGHEGMWFIDIPDMGKFLEEHQEIGSIMINRPGCGNRCSDIGYYSLWITKGKRFNQI